MFLLSEILLNVKERQNPLPIDKALLKLFSGTSSQQICGGTYNAVLLFVDFTERKLQFREVE